MSLYRAVAGHHSIRLDSVRPFSKNEQRKNEGPCILKPQKLFESAGSHDQNYTEKLRSNFLPAPSILVYPDSPGFDHSACHNSYKHGYFVKFAHIWSAKKNDGRSVQLLVSGYSRSQSRRKYFVSMRSMCIFLKISSSTKKKVHRKFRRSERSIFLASRLPAIEITSQRIPLLRLFCGIWQRLLDHQRYAPPSAAPWLHMRTSSPCLVIMCNHPTIHAPHLKPGLAIPESGQDIALENAGACGILLFFKTP